MTWRIVFGAVSLGCLAVAYAIDEYSGFAFGLVAGLCLETLRS